MTQHYAKGSRVRVTTDAFPVLAPVGSVFVVESVTTANAPPVPYYVGYFEGHRLGFYAEELAPATSR
jgi:hypothetical protein